MRKLHILSIMFLLLMFVCHNVKAEDAFSDKFQESSNVTVSAPLSPIEQMFNGKEAAATGKVLHQAGYSAFNTNASGTSRTGKYGADYKLSIGEKVSAYLYGDSLDVIAISGSNLLTPVVNTEVDSKGTIFIQGLGVVSAENRTVSEVEANLNALARQKYRSLKIKLNVSGGSDFSVFVFGHVNKPGKISISNNSSIVDAIGLAGGAKKSGSLRKVIYYSGAAKKQVDLYDILFSSKGEDIIVKPNDKIFIEPIGSVVALRNGVTSPGIYETKDGESLAALINYAGGLLPSIQTNEVVVSSLNKKTNGRDARNLAYSDAMASKLKSGDEVEFKEGYTTAENTVTIQGNIKHPSTFAYKEGMRLSDILKSEDELLEETFITQAVIRRVKGKDNTVETIPVFLKDFFAGQYDPMLEPKDVISIYKNTNAPFVDIFGCINNPKHLTYFGGMNLDDVLVDVQFVDSKTENSEKEVSYTQTQDGMVIQAGAQNNNITIPADDVAVEIISTDGSIKLYYLYDIMVNSNKIKNIPINAYDKIFFRTLRADEEIKNVKVGGFVRFPGAFKFVQGKRLKDVIEMAGGLTEDADLKGIIYIRKNILSKQIELAKKNNEQDIRLLEGRLASGYKQADSAIEQKEKMIESIKEATQDLSNRYSGQIALNIKSNKLEDIKDIDNIYIQDGDEIYIPRTPTHVSIIGEVYNEQSFIYRNGVKAKGYIKMVGGYTPNANKFRIYKVSTDGKARKIHNWSKIAAGDTIVVPRKIAGNDWLTPITQTLQSIASILATVFVVTKI